VIRATWRRDQDDAPSCPRTAHFTNMALGSLPLSHSSRPVRIKVRIPDGDARPLVPWAREHLLPKDCDYLTTAHPQNGDPRAWYVVERDVPMAEWLEVLNVREWCEVWRPRAS
jgi:hypothetical protein